MGSWVRRRLHSRLLKVAFVLGSVAAAGVVAGVVSGADQPSIASDLSSYAPGDTVVLSGEGWQVDETVELVVDDDQDDSWTYEADVAPAVDGTLSHSFDLPELEGEFSVSANALSGTASASFTVAAPEEPAEPTAPAADPKLASDEETYTPGDAVRLSGSDWRAGDAVQITVDDDANDAWDHSADATVAADGSFEQSFDLPSGLAASFTATATDPTDRSASVEFSASFTAATEAYLVRFASGTSAETQSQILAAAGAEDVSFIAPLRIHGVLLPGGAGLEVALDRLRSNPSVTRVEPDRTREAGGTPSDASYGDQWALPKIGWNNVFGELSPSGSARVAILDTGVDGSHPDLDGNVVPGTSILDGSNGLSDPNGHGTAMAGIVAAETNNGSGVAGVGFAGVEVMPVTVLDSDGTGQDSDIIEGVVYAAENDADVILMAFSNPGYSELLQAAIDYAWEEGAVLVAATGNDGSSAPQFPAGDRGVIGVSNTDENDALNGSSNFGQAVFLGAPGTSIATTSAGGGTATISGTSAAAAHVAGAAALVKAASGAANGVIVSRLARNAEPAGSRDQTGNGRLSLDRAIADTSTDSIQPAGADPLGGGGPIVGPYVAAAPSPDFDIAPSHVPAIGSHVFTALVRNTIAPAANDTARCVRITPPAGVTFTAASFVVASPGTGAGETGNWTLTSAAGFVQVRNNESGSGGRGLAGTAATSANWVRFEITATAASVATGTWTARMHQTGTSDCTGGGSTDQLGVRVGGSFSRDYTADFRDASNNVIAAPTATAGSTQPYRIRITRTAGGDDLSYAFVALPTCLTAITGISTTNSTTGGTPDFVASLVDNTFRFVTGGDKLAATGQWTQVHFTATASCAVAAHVFRTASWKNTSPQTAEGDIFKLQTGTGHPTLTVVSANTPPVSVNDSYSTGEDTPLTVPAPGVLVNDTDAQPLTAVLDSAPSNAASFTLNSNGSFSYTPNPNFNGTDSFTYHANDGTADGNIATVTITVTAVNDSPVANNDAATVAEDSGANSIDVLGNDTDADGHTLTVASVTDPANGTAVDNDTNVSYTPDANFCGTDTFDYSVSDGNGGSDTATVTVTVTCANDAPVAGDDVATVAEDSGATTIDVLDNDTDADDTDTLVVASVTDPANGTAVDNDTDVSYTPDANFCGTDTFDYTVSDGNGGSDTATVTVTVTCANDAPNAVNDTATVGEDSGANAIDVLDNDTDADNDTLVVDSVTDPANGTAVDNNTDVSYTPDANFCGTDTFDYTVSDGNGGTDTATVTVTVTCVNDAPLAVDDAYAATEDTLLTVAAPGVLGNDTDPDDASLTAELVDDVSHGTLVLAADGSFTYDPDANYCGPDSFTYRADDGEDESNVATVAITVACVNDAPNAVDDAATVQEDSGATTIDVLDNDTDADATDTLVVASVTDPANGTAVDNDTDVSYTPDANFCGTDTFDYTVSDGNGGTDTATVTVTVTCVNDAPVAVDDLATVAEDASATAIDVLENDTDADPTDTLVVDSVTDPANGTAVDNDTDVSYTPDANFCGTDTFDYTVSDGNGGTDTATVTATVTCVNDAPVAADDSYNATEDTLLTVAAPGVLGNDTDIDDTLLTAVLVDDVSDGTLVLAADGSFTYDPDLNFCGSDSFTYRANDGEDNSNLATVSIAVACVNDAPVANDDSYNATEDTQLTVAAPGVLGNDTDVENSALTAALVGDVSDGALVLAADGSFTYDPDLNFCGSDSFTYRANDGTADSNLATVSITIACVNDAPVANDDVATVAEDSGATTIDVLANDDDAENDTLAVASVTQPAHGSVVDNGTNVTYTPNDDYCGPDSFTYKASDGTDDSNVATVSITVTCVNDAPVASDDSYAATEDTALSVNNAAGVLANDTDVDVGETLTAILVGGPAQAASFTLNANGSFSYTPVLNYCGPDSFTYKANDGEANSNVATASIAVECVNDAPVADDDAATVAEDAGTTAIDVLANDSDVDGDPLTIGSASDPDHGTVVVTGGGAGLTYEPADDYCGTDSFTYTASDGNGGSDTATVSITVTCVNDVPVAEAGGPYTGNEGATVTLDGSSSDDVEGPLTYAWTVTPQTGGADDPGAGASCSFVAGTTATSEKPKVSCTDDGIYDVGLTVTDNEGATDGDSTTLTLENVAPTVAQPTFGSALIGCQTAVTLSNISFTDPGTIDRPWTIDIDWGDGSSHDNYQTMTQGSQAPRTHVYATAGTFTATVSVTDKDVDESSNTGSASSSNTTQVYPYSVQFRPPVDGSNATTVVDNKMKNGRTVPVKVTIRDLCSGADLTSSSAPVTIKVTKASGTSGVGDPVEEYADAGNANDGTNEFRWSGEHWIYNLDSKSLGLVVGNRYRVDVYVGSARATVTTWAIIAPVK